MTVNIAKQKDLEDVLAWLEIEFRRDGEGFWNNKNLISKSLDDKELFVIREDGVAVAFQVGRYSAHIVSVRQDLQKQGYGSALFENSLKLAQKDDVTVLRVECMPEKSLSYWEKHGFERYGDMSEWGKITAQRFVPKHFELPRNADSHKVNIKIYPESVKYYKDSEVLPFQSFEITGAYLEPEIIQLSQRVIAHANYDRNMKDTVVKVELGKNSLCFCKVKYEDARSIGWQYDDEGNAFYIDKIFVSNLSV